MGMYKKLANGDLQKLAGYTVIADGSCAEVRHGTATFLPTTGTEYYDAAVTFETAMSDTDYQIIFDGFIFNGMAQRMGSYIIENKTVTGFNVRYYCDGTPDSRGGSANYTAIKLITMEGYTELKNKVDNPDSSPTEDSLNLCTSGGIYDAIKNAKNIFTGTLAEWEALTAEQKAEFDVAQIDDGIQVGSLIPTRYTTTEQFTGKYWIDGKKIYRKVLSGTTSATGNTFPSNTDSVNASIGSSTNTIIDYRVYVNKPDTGVTLKDGEVLTNVEFVSAWSRNNTHLTNPNTIAIATGTGLTSCPFTCVVEYTKN